MQLAVLRSRGGEPATTVPADARFRPGDVLRFRVQAPTRGHALVLNVDDAGSVTRYFPEATAPGAVAAGEQVLPGAIELDGSRLHEQLLLAFSAAPLSEERGARRGPGGLGGPRPRRAGAAAAGGGSARHRPAAPEAPCAAGAGRADPLSASGAARRLGRADPPGGGWICHDVGLAEEDVLDTRRSTRTASTRCFER